MWCFMKREVIWLVIRNIVQGILMLVSFMLIFWVFDYFNAR